MLQYWLHWYVCELNSNPKVTKEKQTAEVIKLKHLKMVEKTINKIKDTETKYFHITFNKKYQQRYVNSYRIQ